MRIPSLVKIIVVSSFIALTQWSCTSGYSHAQVQSLPAGSQAQVPESDNPPETEPESPSSDSGTPNANDPQEQSIASCNNGKTPKQMGLAEYTKLVRESIDKVNAFDPKTALTFPLVTKCPITISTGTSANGNKPVKRRQLRVIGYYSSTDNKVMPFYAADLSKLLKAQLRGINQQKLTELSQSPNSNGKNPVLSLAVLDTKTGKIYLTKNVALVGIYRDLINAISNDQLQPLAPNQQPNTPSTSES
ncbi:MAG: hypothetical protein WCO45_01480 [Pseudanabaena sp. ELA607]|jgi:hypothetical protein